MKALRIINPGPLATVQDLGRFGFRDRGVPLSGAMDRQALRVANLLAGNPQTAAGLEITIGGFRAEFLGEADFVLAGAETGARLNGRPAPNWVCHRANPGDVVALGLASPGVRVYLAVAGGIDVGPVMSSSSTFLRGGFGGFEGRALRGRDVISFGVPAGRPIAEFPAGLIPPYSDSVTLRTVAGPQDDCITPGGLRTFFSQEYVVTDRSDRMGSLLSGPRIEHVAGGDIISDGTCPGSVQVPGSGLPTILAADCQTTGGYVKIATVIAVDLPLAGQLGPGARVRFEEVGLDEARLAYLKNEYLLRSFHDKHGKTA